MKIQNRSRRYHFHCPNDASVEKILLRAHKNPVVFRAFQQHMVVCSRCQRRVKRIKIFYDILERELAKAQSAKVVDFVESLERKVDS